MRMYLKQLDGVVVRYGICLTEQMIDSLNMKVDSLVIGLVVGEGFCRRKAQENRGGILHVCSISGPNGAFLAVVLRVAGLTLVAD